MARVSQEKPNEECPHGGFEDDPIVPKTSPRKLQLGIFALIALRLLFAGFILIATTIALLWVYSSWPYQWHLPEGMPLVLGFSTDMGVEEVVNVLRTKYFVKDIDISVQIIKEENIFFNKTPLRHQIVVENFFAPGLSKKQLECRFLKNRLMTMLFRPELSEDECKALLGEDYKKYVTGLRFLDERGEYKSASTDELWFGDLYKGSAILSKLLCYAYIGWCKDKCTSP